MTPVPARSPGAIEVDLGGDLVIVDFDDRQLHTLNRSAAATWREIDGRRDLDELCRVLAAAHGVAEVDLRDDVAALVERFEQMGLIGGTGPAAPPAPDPATATIPASGQSADACGPYAALDWTFEVAGADPDVRCLVERVLSPLRSHAHPVARVDVHGVVGDYALSTNGGRVAVASDAGGIVDQIVALANRRAVEATRDAVCVHAGGVAGERGVVVLPAASNQGKSTLVAHLVRRGFAYLTDESVAIEVNTTRARPYHKPISLDPGSFRLFPGLASDTDCRRWQVDPRDLGGGLSPGGSIAAIVVPRRIEGSRPSLGERDPDAGFRSLIENAFAFRHVGPSAVTTLAGVAASVPCFELIHGGIEHHGDEIATLVAEATRRSPR